MVDRQSPLMRWVNASNGPLICDSGALRLVRCSQRRSAHRLTRVMMDRQFSFCCGSPLADRPWPCAASGSFAHGLDRSSSAALTARVWFRGRRISRDNRFVASPFPCSLCPSCPVLPRPVPRPDATRSLDASDESWRWFVLPPPIALTLIVLIRLAPCPSLCSCMMVAACTCRCEVSCRLLCAVLRAAVRPPPSPFPSAPFCARFPLSPSLSAESRCAHSLHHPLLLSALQFRS
jgi:hypothetical protein